MATAVETPLTPREYLELERKAEFRSQYIDGVMYPMAGASREHNNIAGTVYAKVFAALEGRPDEVYINDMRVRVDPDGLCTYPDVAASPAPEFWDDAGDTLLNPSVIVEVLSPSAEAGDRGPKSARYRGLESLREYVLIARDRVSVERLERGGDRWILTIADSLDAAPRLESLGVEVPLRAIYARTPLAEGGGHGIRMCGPVVAARRRRGAESC